MDLRKRLAKTLDLSTAATAALAAAATAAASNQNQQLARGTGNNVGQCVDKISINQHANSYNRGYFFE